MLCDKCKKREATLHFTQVSCDAGVVSKTTNLCSECGESFEGPAEAREAAAAWKDARCRYCGGEPHVGGGHSLDPLSGAFKISFMCKPCAEEYYRFLSEKWPGFGDVNITDEQIASINRTDKVAVLRHVEEHMKTW